MKNKFCQPFFIDSLCIFDIDATDLDRYSVHFLDIDIPPKLIIIDDPKEYKKYLQHGIFKKENVYCSAWDSINKLSSLLLDFGIKYLLIDAHRIPDVHIVIAAKKSGCKVIYLQHGMYIPFMKRVNSHYVRKSIKTLRYLYYSVDASIAVKNIHLLKSLFGIHVLGKTRRSLMIYHNEIYPDISGVYSKYWLSWHIDHYSFPQNTLFIMGTPDFKKYSFTEKLSEEYVSYCYQTLLEDGRISEKEMFAFYEKLHNWAKKNKVSIIVKVHPLASKQVLKKLENKYRFQLEFDHIPNTAIVIGHYSSLLPYWGVHGSKVVCVELNGHDIDHSISSWSHVINDLNELEINDIAMPNKKLCLEYFSIPLDSNQLYNEIFQHDIGE